MLIMPIMRCIMLIQQKTEMHNATFDKPFFTQLFRMSKYSTNFLCSSSEQVCKCVSLLMNVQLYACIGRLVLRKYTTFMKLKRVSLSVTFQHSTSVGISILDLSFSSWLHHFLLLVSPIHDQHLLSCYDIMVSVLTKLSEAVIQFLLHADRCSIRIFCKPCQQDFSNGFNIFSKYQFSALRAQSLID